MLLGALHWHLAFLGSNFNHGTTQTARDLPLKGSRFAPIKRLVYGLALIQTIDPSLAQLSVQAG
jgi:hypothetical protein